MTDKNFIPANIKTMFTGLDALDPMVSYNPTSIPNIQFQNWDQLSGLEKTTITTIMTTAGFVAID